MKSLQRSTLALALATCWAAPAGANPTNPQVVAGQVAIAQQGKLLTITNSDRSIINWGGFSIAAGETTRFVQSGAASAVLNRVTGATPSELLGQLQSNGRVYLINPNGIVIGNGARIDTAGFIASSLALSDADFLSGRLRFGGGDAAGGVINRGAIHGNGSLVALIGTQVENHGSIESAGGTAVAAAARGVELVDAYSPNIRVRLDTASDAQLHRVLNRGVLTVAVPAASDAAGLRVEGGRIRLVSAGDTLLEGNAVASADNAAGHGGSVHVLGTRVGLFDSTKVGAGGTAGGGEILVGGDYQGRNPDVINATRSFVGKDVALTADAIGTGDGGKVIVWADEVTRYHGHASVKGGAQGGDGGLVEVSGKQALEFRGSVALDAPLGRAGTLLLDPLNITVQAGAGTLDAHLTSPGDPTLAFGDAAGVTGTLDVAELAAFTSGTVELQADNDISFNSAVTMQSGVTLKAAAMNNVNVNAGITTSGGGALLLEADTDLSGAGRVNLAAVTIDAPLTIGKVGVPLSGNATVTGNVILAQDAQVLGSLELPAGRTLTINTGKTLTVSGGMTVNTGFFAPATITGGGTLEIPAGQTLLFNSNDTQFFHFNNVTVNNAGTFQLSGSTGNNAAVLNNNAVFNNQAGGQILFSQPGNTLGTSSGIGTLNNSGTIASSGGNNATLTMSVFNANDGSIFTTGTGSVIRNAFSSSYDGNLTLNSALRLTGGTHVFADGVTLNGTGSVVHDGATTVTMNNVTANVPYTLTSSDTLTLAAGKTFTLGSGMTTNTASFAPVTITGGGTLEIPAGQTLLFNSNDTQFFHFNNVTVNNAGTFQLSGSTGNNAAVLNNNAVFNNQAGGQILFSQPGNTLGTSSGIGTLNNSGTIASSGGNNATLTMSVFNANDGSIFTTGTGSVIRNAFSSSYDGNLTLNSALRLTGGTHVFADGVTLNGTGSVVHDGATTVTMNNVTANVPYTLTSSDTLTLAAGKTFTLGSGMTTNTASFAPVTITGGGTLEIPAGQTLLFNSNDTQFFHFNNVTVNNAGTFQLSGSTGNNAAVLNNNAVFNNQAGGQILFSQPGNTLGTSSGIGTLNNSGTIASSGGNNATLTMSVFNANDGSIFTTGTGSVIRNAFSSSYDGNLTLNSALRLTGGTHVFADGVTLNGTGSVVHDGATTVTMNNVTANVPYTLTSSDTLTLAAGKTFTLGSGMTTNTASFAPVTITGGGTLEIPAGQTLLFNSNDTQFFHFNNVTVNNAGTFQLSGSTGNNAAVLNNNAVFNNQAGGQILFSQPGNTLGTSAGIGTLNNSGTIAAAGGDIVISVAVVTNSGLLDVTAGNASIPPGLALLAGSIDVGVGRNVSIGGTGLDWQGGTLTGVGTYTLSSLTITGSGARVLNGPTFTINNLSLPGGSLDVQAGTLNLTGAASTAAGSTLLVSGGSFTSTGTLANAGTFSKSSAGTTTIAAAFSNAGTVNANAGVLDFTGGYVQSAGQVMLGGGALAGNLTLNGGTLGGAGTLTGNLVNTSGIVAPGNSPGLLTVAGDYTQGAGGQLNIELGGTVAGTGYDRLSVAGNATLDGTVFVTIPGAFAPGTGDLFDFMTIGGIRSGSFATTTLPTGYTGNVSYPAGLAQLQFSAVPATAVSSTATATTTALKIAAVDLFETLDKLSPSLMPAPPLAHDDEDEENNVGVVVCK